MEPESPALAGRFFTTESSGKPHRDTSSPLNILLSLVSKNRTLVFSWVYWGQKIKDYISQSLLASSFDSDYIMTEFSRILIQQDDLI